MKKKWFLLVQLITILTSTVVSVLVCSLLLKKKLYGAFLFCMENTTDLLGIIISCISIIITSYFVILAIDAYGRVREIKEAVRIATKDLEAYRDSAFSTLRSLGNASINVYQSAIKLTEVTNRFNEGDEKTRNLYLKWRKDFNRDLYRLGLIPHMLDENTRIDFIRNLISFAEPEDLEKLKDICKSETESEELKRTAREVLDIKNEQTPSDEVKEKPSLCHRFKMAWDLFWNPEQ